MRSSSSPGGGAPGGTVLACIPNDEGAKSGEADLKALAGLSGNITKRHCRAYWAHVDAERIDTALLSTWMHTDAPRPILDGILDARLEAPQTGGEGREPGGVDDHGAQAHRRNPTTKRS